MSFSLNPIKWFTKGVEVVGDTVVKVKGAWSGNQQEKDQQNSELKVATLNAYSQEFVQRQNRTWFDSFCDGMNRLIRPAIVCGIFYFYYIAITNPTQFQLIVTAMDAIPEQMWHITMGIISFYFACREFQKNRDSKLSLNDKEFAAMTDRIRSLKRLAKQQNQQLIREHNQNKKLEIKAVKAEAQNEYQDTGTGNPSVDAYLKNNK